MRITRTGIITALAAGVIAMGIACLCTLKANADEETQTLTCTEIWDQTMREICVSKTLVCVRIFGSDEMQCHLRPIKNQE